MAADPTCWLAQFTDTPCDGALVRCHLLQRQWLRQEYPEGAVWLQGRSTALSWYVWERELRHVATSEPVERMSLRQLERDPRLWVKGCGGIAGNGGHHGAFDGYRLLVPRGKVPWEAVRFIVALGLDARWERDRRFSETVAA